MKIIFLIKDFLSTRNGKIVLAALAILLSISWLSSLSDKTQIQESLSKGESNKSANETSSSPSILKQVEKNDSFETFVPPKQREAAPKVILEKAIPSIPDIPLVEVEPDLPLIFEPLLKEEREPSPKISSPQVSASDQLPKIQLGSRIHCQLVSSPSSAEKSSPVIARVVRPFIRDGILLIPVGSSVFGRIEKTNGKTLHTHPEWTVQTPAAKTITLSALAYGKATDKSSARVGLTGHLEDLPRQNPASKQLLGNVIKGIAALGKDTVRTGIGEYVPSTTRNVVINGSSQIIDTVFTKEDKNKTIEQPIVYAPAGQEFTLVVSSVREKPRQQSQHQPNVDQLLEKLLRRRLEE